MTTALAWADYLDARLRLVHEWAGEGLSFVEMARRLTPDPHDLALLMLTATIPPQPGSSRDQLISARIRLDRAERQLTERAEPLPRRPHPPNSQVRALLLDPDPNICGCQHWTNHPRNGEHHPHCAHAAAKP